eukprot:1159826-Pelagomonas_calceolata.AAC.4
MFATEDAVDHHKTSGLESHVLEPLKEVQLLQGRCTQSAPKRITPRIGFPPARNVHKLQRKKRTCRIWQYAFDQCCKQRFI